MENKDLKYNAFISYRHADLDKFVAENLHKLIETYKMPKAVVEKYNITDNNVRRLFRDQDELPLSPSLEDPIITALKNSEFLIVICSPRLKESLWCKKEIENFIKFHGREKILCVLIEGEPKDSFPDEVLYYTQKTKNKSGKTVTKKVYCEPLAMDVKGANKKEVLKNLKSDIVRIMAPLYKLNYDDIKRRHEERELKRKANIFKLIAVASLIFGVYSFMLFSKIFISSKQLKYDQSISLAEDAREYLEKDNRREAVKNAYLSVTKYKGNKMPITPKGIYELTDSLGLYYLHEFVYPISQLDTIGSVNYIKTDNDKKLLLSADSSGELVLWDLLKEKRIKTFFDTFEYMTDNYFTFVGTKAIAYLSTGNKVVLMDLKDNKFTNLEFDTSMSNVTSSKEGKYLEVNDTKKIYFYETKNYKEVASFDIPSGLSIIGEKYFDEKEENFIFVASETRSLFSSNSIKLYVYNIAKKKITNTLPLQSYLFEKILFDNDNMVILSTKKSGNKTDMVITKYNYINNKVIYRKIYAGEGVQTIAMNLSDKNNKTIMVFGNEIAYLLDYDTGKQKAKYALNKTIIDIYPSKDDGNYMLFTKDCGLHYITPKEGYNDSSNNTQYMDAVNCSLNSYKRMLGTKAGYLGVPYNENRIIIYGYFDNDDIKEIEYEEKKFDSLKMAEIKEIAKEYNSKRKSMISEAFYSDDKKLVFLAYTNNRLEIYDTETKKLLNSIDSLKNGKYLSRFVTKTKNDEYLITTTGGESGYILNKDFELIAFVPRLYDYNSENDKMIIKSYRGKFYEVKIYSDKEVINKAKEFLKY